ncbi:ADS3 [Symbiodinium sp. CCMP2592]|nr:ADS3 [Symbiodinium sp. CCMP2592]
MSVLLLLLGLVAADIDYTDHADGPAACSALLQQNMHNKGLVDIASGNHMGQASSMALNTTNPGCSEMGWKLVFRQTLPYLWQKDILTLNEFNPRASNFAILDHLDKYKVNGKFHFKLTWPNSGLADQIWKQTSTPTTSNQVTGYEVVQVSHTAHEWGGLRTGHSKALLDGSNGNKWFYALGAYTFWKSAYPGPNSPVEMVELYVHTKVPPPCLETSAIGATNIALDRDPVVSSECYTSHNLRKGDLTDGDTRTHSTATTEFWHSCNGETESAKVVLGQETCVREVKIFSRPDRSSFQSAGVNAEVLVNGQWQQCGGTSTDVGVRNFFTFQCALLGTEVRIIRHGTGAISVSEMEVKASSDSLPLPVSVPAKTSRGYGAYNRPPKAR